MRDPVRMALRLEINALRKQVKQLVEAEEKVQKMRRDYEDFYDCLNEEYSEE